MQPVVNIVICDMQHIAGIPGKNNRKGLQSKENSEYLFTCMADEVGEYFWVRLREALMKEF